MTVRQYIGARYVPLFADPIQWDSTSSYEPLTVVMNEGTSYVSKQSVPVGIQITNETYWLRWADYNAQIEEYIRQVQTYTTSVDAINDALPIADFDANETVKDAIDNITVSLPSSDFDENNTVKNAIDSIAALLPSTEFDSEHTVDMAIDSLTNSISAIEATTAVFNTVADMITDVTDETLVKTLGYYEVGIGGANYLITNVSINAASITLSNGNYATPIFDPLNIYVSMFGVKGDGIQDDSDYLQLVYDIANWGATVFIDVDKIYITKTINIEKSDIMTFGFHAYGSKSNIICDDSLAIGIYSKGNRNTFYNICIYTPTKNNTCTGIKFYPDTSISGISENDVDTKIINCGFQYLGTCIDSYGKNVYVSNCVFVGILKAVKISYHANISQIRGIIIENSIFHSCFENANATSNSWNNFSCMILEISDNVPLIEAIIRGNSANAGTIMGFYRGPTGVVIDDNKCVEGGSYLSLIYLKSNAAGEPRNAIVFSNNTLLNDGSVPSSNHVFYCENMIYGILNNAVIANNIIGLIRAHHWIECADNINQFFINGNQITPFNTWGGSPTADNSLLKIKNGVIYFIGNNIRSQGSNRVLLETSNSAIFFNSSNITTNNNIEGFASL